MASRAILSNFFEEQRTQNYQQYLSGLARALFPTTLLEKAVYSLHAGSLQARFKFMIIPVRRSGQSPVHFTPCSVTTLFNLLGYKFWNTEMVKDIVNPVTQCIYEMNPLLRPCY